MLFRSALHYLHSPPPDAAQQLLEDRRHPCQIRLAFEELLAHNLALQLSRGRNLSLGAPDLSRGTAQAEAFISSLPFKLTAAQQRVRAEILQDLSRETPMLRLVQGDVGSGKTVIAATAALQAVASGYQVAIMAPTEILSQQHLSTFSEWFSDSPIKIEMLSGKLKAGLRRELLARLASGDIDLLIGTHALFQDIVEFSRLGLVVVDEQHRFGVHQRLALTQKVHPEYGKIGRAHV